MHAKKKNKKANKPPNLNPPQNLENVSKTAVKVEETKPKCELKEEKVIKPEVVSEFMATPVSDIKETEIEMPKKPKRNKGKKNKQDKDEEFIENIPDKLYEVKSETDAKVQETVQAVVAEKKGDEENKDPLGEATAIPSARKNKNKKKVQEKHIEESKTPVEISEPVPKEHKVENIKKNDSEFEELSSSKPEVSKPDAKKKRNKKKNRTDSERSDKSDNVILYPSAFQKCMVEDEIPKKEQFDVMAKGDKQLIMQLPLEAESANTETTVKETQIIDDIKQAIEDETKGIKEIPKEENKGKKKNKREKKQPQCEITEDPKLEDPQEILMIKDDVLTQNVIFNEPKLDVKESLEILLDLHKEKDSSPKLKATIAKPVEKKRKSKQDTQSSENVSTIESLDVMKGDITKDAEPPKELEIKLEDIPTVNITESRIPEQTKQELPVIQKSEENINVPSDNVMGKKRKKSPKPPKHKDAHNMKLDIVEVLPELKDSCETVPELLKPEMHIVTNILEEISPKIFDALPEEILKPKEDQKMNIEESKQLLPRNLLERPLTPEAKVDDEGFETKTNKKKKKTPKVPQITSEMKEPITTEIQKTESDQGKTKQWPEEKIDFPLDLSFSAALEVQSVKSDESMVSSLDAIPDVFFVRSSSQHILDGNNNTVIQELTYVEEIKLDDPKPFIEGLGETPICTPEIITPGIRMTEIESKTPTEEKTDVKSKMIEVNQDMEELRLSIERSLAEFTDLEMSEQESEKKFETKDSMKKEKSPFKDNPIKATKEENTQIMSEFKENIPTKIETKELETPSLIPPVEIFKPTETPPVCPTRKDNKGKSKSKKKENQETAPATTTVSGESTTSQSKDNAKEEKQEKSEQKSEQTSTSTQEKGKQQSAIADDNDNTDVLKDKDHEKQPIYSLLPGTTEQNDFGPIENFEDALTSSVDDVNKSFDMIANDVDEDNIEVQMQLAANKPEINITDATEDTDTNRNEKVNPVSQPKNLLGQIDFPVQSNKTDYKKEKNKTPNARQARVKIKDSMDVEAKKHSKESQTDDKKARKDSDKSVKESFSKVTNDNDEYVYKYSFRKVFLQTACHVCNKDLIQARVPCVYCNLVFYCGARHKDEDWPQHQALCFAVSTLAHMKDQKHIYADAQNATGQDYRLLRMQMIVSCEKVLKRRLVPWEQEAMLYPRICAEVSCREWRQGKLKDCDGCGQLSYCSEHPEHLSKSHARWCKSYSLYRKLVSYQQTRGRLEPRLPTKVMKQSELPGKMNEVLAAMYQDKIDMNDIQYAALTQLATAPLTTAYCLQLCPKATSTTNGVYKKQPFTIHVVGAELQFEADALNKWEVFFLHLRPDVEELKVVLVSPMLNPGNLPLDLLGRIKLCENCHQNKRRIVFKFEDNKNYFEYRSSEDFINPDIICAFNPSIQRSSIYNGKDPWPASINSILKLKQPFIITSYTLNELRKDIARIKQVAEIDFKFISEAGFNNFASVRPDRNFISDDEMPLLFKNYCVAVLLGC